MLHLHFFLINFADSDVNFNAGIIQCTTAGVRKAPQSAPSIPKLRLQLATFWAADEQLGNGFRQFPPLQTMRRTSMTNTGKH